MKCTRCDSANIIKNGFIHTGKQKFSCKDCGQKFGSWDEINGHKCTARNGEKTVAPEKAAANVSGVKARRGKPSTAAAPNVPAVVPIQHPDSPGFGEGADSRPRPAHAGGNGKAVKPVLTSTGRFRCPRCNLIFFSEEVAAKHADVCTREDKIPLMIRLEDPDVIDQFNACRELLDSDSDLQTLTSIIEAHYQDLQTGAK